MNNLTPIKDISLKAFDEILDERFKKLELKVLELYDVDKIPVDVLPHLARQYHITGNEGWIQADTVEKKRTLIKNAIRFHRLRGTKYSIIKALESVGYKAELSEWFEYKGKPFYFKVNLILDEKGIDIDTRNSLIDLVKSYKNVRSHLESFDSALNSTAKPQIVCITSLARTIEVYPNEL